MQVSLLQLQHKHCQAVCDNACFSSNAFIAKPATKHSCFALISTHDDDDDDDDDDDAARIFDSFTTLPACGNAGFDYHPFFFITTHPVCPVCATVW